ncbi:MAG: hypothetical protein ACTHMI_24270 [Mucilaginibacter sp.]
MIEAENLSAGLADKAAAKNTTRSAAEGGDFLSSTLHGLGRRRGINLPQAKAKGIHFVYSKKWSVEIQTGPKWPENINTAKYQARFRRGMKICYSGKFTNQN